MSSCTDLLVVSWWIILSPPKRRSVGWWVQIGPWPRAHMGQLGRGFSKKGIGELGGRVTHTQLFQWWAAIHLTRGLWSMSHPLLCFGFGVEMTSFISCFINAR